jgi:hypothetical protein
VSLRFLFYIVLVFVAVVYGIYGYKGFTKPFRILVVLVLCVFISECIGRWFAYNRGSSIPAYHLLILAQMILYPYIYLTALPAGKRLKMIITILAWIGFCFSVFNSLFLQTFFVFPSYSILLLSLFTVCLALLSFYFMLEQPVDKSPVKVPLFWFNLGNLFFYCITFFMFGFFTPFIKRSGGLPEWGFIFIFAANIGLYTCYLVALRLEKETA